MTRKIVKLEWFCNSKENPIRTGSVPAFSGKDTLYISWADASLKKIYVSLTDNCGIVWWDSLAVKVVDSAHITDQIPSDTIISIQDILIFTGKASDNDGIIKEYAWDYDGNGIFDTVTSPGKQIEYSYSIYGTFHAVLRITYENGNSTFDTTVITVLADEDQIPHADILCIAAGDQHTLVLLSDSTIWGWGRNGNGVMGDGSPTDPPSTRSQPLPKQINVQNIQNIHKIMSNSDHTFFLQHDGTLLGCGYNYSGQLGDSSRVQRLVPVLIMRDVKSAACGSAYSLVLKNDQTLWSWGDNRDGELGDGTREQRNRPVFVMDHVEFISAGGANTLILKTDGTLWGCGNNDDGQLGIGNTEDQLHPVQIMTNVKTAVAAGSKTLILKNNGTLWACGNNWWGNLGDGTEFNRLVPVKVLIP